MAWVHLDVTLVKRATDKAILVVLEDDEEVWLPLSQRAIAEAVGKRQE